MPIAAFLFNSQYSPTTPFPTIGPGREPGPLLPSHSPISSYRELVMNTPIHWSIHLWVYPDVLICQDNLAGLHSKGHVSGVFCKSFPISLDVSAVVCEPYPVNITMLHGYGWHVLPILFDKYGHIWWYSRRSCDPLPSSHKSEYFWDVLCILSQKAIGTVMSSRSCASSPIGEDNIICLV